ncbi:FAD-linked sulfhydryl oxidase-like protein ERV2 [Pleomassaria siparia CBS 279.74]|uniref:Sulfhydryl oxidase n=1 Tax=Pleomassaria siparia CBS 279.74 TaxID=1314801 RepID=A0A6G1K6V5_9PLEO|nr:FAD-linked sulfhydryl oxidase-like protein ERV2 [Pleomassaria siparia CBS 279.74]
MVSTGASRRILILFILAFAFVSVFMLSAARHPSGQPAPLVVGKTNQDEVSGASLIGHAIAPKLGNATAKAELGRAAWKVLHTTFGRFPEKPTDDEKEALRSYVHLFQRLYPCGECAEHFGQVLAKYPPQVSSRSAAAMWGCFVHNVVNKRLKKPEFNCENIGDAYDCGCAEDPRDVGKGEQPA